MEKKGNHKLLNIFLLISIVIVCGYFLWRGTGITGAIVGIEKADIDNRILEDLSDNEEVPVIITLKDEKDVSDLEEQKEIVRKNQEEVIGELNLEDKKGFLGILTEEKEFEIGQQYTVVNAISGTITEEGLKKLERNPRVKKISYDYPISPFLSESVPLINADDVWSYSIGNISIDGSGETICIIDTGVDYTHPALGNCTNESFLNGACSKVIGGFDFGDNDSDPFPAHWHGTHVAGIVASEDSIYWGVAPGTKIVALKVFNSSGEGFSSWAISAIDWCVSNASKFNISVISMSVGVMGAVYSEYCDAEDSFAEKSSWAASQGMFVTAAAGNDFSSTGIESPACGENVTSVGSTTKSDSISSFSNSANILDILAPGDSITSTVPGGSFLTLGGTSMSTPHVAGAAALILNYAKLFNNEVLTSSQVRDILKATGKLIYDSRNGLNFSRIDVAVAILSLDNATPIIEFNSPTPENNSVQDTLHITINITSNEVLSNSILEWEGVNETMLGDGKNFYSIKSNLAEGNYSFVIHVIDLANNTYSTEERIFTVKNIPPIIVIDAPLSNSYYNSPFSLNITVNDYNISSSDYQIINQSGVVIKNNIEDLVDVNNFQWEDYINISEENFTDGTYTLLVSANDSSGESNNSQVSFTIDKTKPVLSGAVRIPDEVYNNDTIFFYINVTETNLDNVLISGFWDGEWEDDNMSLDEGERFVFNISELSDGDNISYKFSAIDLAGNEEETETFSFIVQEQEEIENNIPIVNITSPLNGTVIELGESVQFNATAEDADGDNLTFFWNFDDGTNSTEQDPLKQYNETGDFLASFIANDGQEESKEAKVTLFVNDSTAPEEQSIIFDDELDKDQYSVQEVTAAFFDLSGISGLSLSSGDSAVTLVDTTEDGNTWTYSWNITLPDSYGSKTFIIEAVDNSTNKNSGNLSYEFSVIGCGDGVVNGLEDCDGSVFDGGDTACSDWGNFDGGALSCGDDCNVDTSGCTEESEEDTSEETTESSTSGSSGGSSGGGSAPAAPVEIVSVPEPIIEPEIGLEEEPVEEAFVEESEAVIEETVVNEEKKGFFSSLTGMIARNLDFNQWGKKQKIIAGSGLGGFFLAVILLTVFLVCRKMKNRKNGHVKKIKRKTELFINKQNSEDKDEKKQQALEEERPNEMEVAEKED